MDRNQKDVCDRFLGDKEQFQCKFYSDLQFIYFYSCKKVRSFFVTCEQTYVDVREGSEDTGQTVHVTSGTDGILGGRGISNF